MTRALLAVALLIASAFHGNGHARRLDDELELRGRAQVTGPRAAGRQWAPMDFDVAIILPNGLTYCPLPDDRNGMDRAQTFFVAPPLECRGGRPVIQAGARSSPSLHVEVWPNHFDDKRAREFAARRCSRPQPIPVTLLGHAAIGCRIERSDTVLISVFDLVTIDRQPSDAPPAGIITLTLRTSASQASADLKVFGAFTSGVYLCSRSATPVNHRSRCPADGPW